MSTAHTSHSSHSALTGAVRRIPPPDGRREPLKINIYERMTGAATQLQPLFPYHDAGAMVPCGAVFTGGPDKGEFGQFFHWNSVEEIAVVFGANGALLQTGQIFATQRLHGVNSFLRDPRDPEAFGMMTITQRQSDDQPQREAIIFRCEKCHDQLLRFEYNATAKGVQGYEPGSWGGDPDNDEYPVFNTTGGAVEAAARFSRESVRTCGKCGHVNDEFPVTTWGWRRYVEQTVTANRARAALSAVIEEIAGTEVVGA